MHRLFYRAWQRHFKYHKPPGDYEVCRRPLCRLFWWLERWVWYGGETGKHGPLTIAAGRIVEEANAIQTR